MYCKRIIALFAVFAILSSFFVLSASADFPVSVQLDVVEAADWIYNKGYNNLIGPGVNSIGKLFDKDICTKAPIIGGKHKFIEQRTQVDGKTGLYYICEYCSKSAGEVMNGTTDEDGTTTPGAYQEYVSSLPSNGYSSDGSILWYVTLNDVPSLPLKFPNASNFSLTVYVSDLPIVRDDLSVSATPNSRGIIVSGRDATRPSNYYITLGPIYLSAPVLGSYVLQSSNAVIGRCVGTQTGSHSVLGYYSEKDYGFLSAGTEIRVGSLGGERPSDTKLVDYFYTFSLPVFRVTPVPSGDSLDYTVIYDSSTRMGNIGGNYGTINNDNSVTQYTTQYIVNEGDNTYTNPVTGQTQPILDWSYNYDDRSYTLNLDNSKTSTVTYGDEKVSINETTIDGNGNTVTNKYEVNYIVNNGGGGSSDLDPSASPSPSNDPGGSGSGGGGSTVGPGTLPGTGDSVTQSLSRVFKSNYAKITQAYGNDGHGGTDCVPQSGGIDTVIAHSEGDVVWVQTGQLNNQGSTGDASYGNAVKIKHSNGYYTLYAHLDSVSVTNGSHVYKGQALGRMGNTGNSYGAHLHFEVRDDTDTRLNSDPYINADLPGLEGGGKSQSDRPWWEKIGDLIGLGFTGLMDMFGAVVGKVLDGLIALLEMLIGKLTTVVETVLSVFDQIPALFGGFLDLLGLLFPFLPPEIVTILTFGIIAVVAIWIIKALLGK